MPPKKANIPVTQTTSKKKHKKSKASDSSDSSVAPASRTSFYKPKMESINEADREKFGGGRFKDYLYESHFIGLSMYEKSAFIHFWIEDFYKRAFPPKLTSKKTWESIYEKETKEFDLNWTCKKKFEGTLNCKIFESVNEVVEWNLYFTPYQTNIKELWVTCKPSMFHGGGYGLYNALPIHNKQLIGLMFGFEHCNKNNAYDLAKKLITGYTFETNYGVLNAVCGMNADLFSGTKPHPFFGMYMINDVELSYIKARGYRKSTKKSACIFYSDLRVTMREEITHHYELTMAYEPDDEDDE